MNDFRIPLGTLVEGFIDFITETFGLVFDFIRAVFDGAYESVEFLLVRKSVV